MAALFRKKHLFTPEREENILDALRRAEASTSGELRIYIEAKNPMMDPLDRAREIFFRFNMHQTRQRNGVLIYIAHKHKELALYGDEGIHQQLGTAYWNKEVQMMLSHFRNNEIAEGLIRCMEDIGSVLKEKFPFIPGEDKNELPDDIIFGK